MIHVKGLLKAHHHAGKSLIHFEKVNIANFHPAFAQDFFRHRNRTCQHDGRISAYFRGRAYFSTRLKAVFFAKFLIAN